MAVIYLGPKQNTLGDIGEGVLSLVQQIGQARSQQMLKQKQQQIAQIQDPNQQVDAAMKLLGPDAGGDFIEKLTKAKLGPLALQKAQLDQQLLQTQTQEEKNNLANQPLAFKLKQQQAEAETLEAQSRAMEAKARAAGVPSEVARNLAETDEVRARTRMLNSEVAGKQQFAASLDALLKGAPPDAPVSPPGAPPGTPPTPDVVQPKHVASIMDFALGNTKSVSDVDLPMPTLSPGMGNKLHMTPEQTMEAATLAKSGDIAEAMKVIGGAGKIASRYDQTLAPGFKMKIGVRDDGSEVPLGAPRYEPNKANLSVDSRTAQGIALWNATIEGINKIASDPKMGNQGTRLLMSTVHSIAPQLDLESVFPKQSGKDFYDWQAQAGHALVAAAGLLSGARSNQMLMKSLQDTIPKPGQPMDQIQTNLAASRRITDTMARDLFSSLVADGKAVPDELREIIKAGGLDKKPTSEIATGGLGAAGGDSAKPAPAASGEGAPAGERGEGGAVGAAPPGGASTGAGTDIKPQVIGGKLITPDYVQQIAKEHGLTPEQVLEGLKNAAGQ